MRIFLAIALVAGLGFYAVASSTIAAVRASHAVAADAVAMLERERHR